MNTRQIFLCVASCGLLPIALSYGVCPRAAMDFLYDIALVNTNGVHIFRAVMGLYMAFICLWVGGVLKAELRQPALYSLVFFMGGLATGRLLSLIVDGMPHVLLFVYMLLEFAFGAVGYRLLSQPD